MMKSLLLLALVSLSLTINAQTLLRGDYSRVLEYMERVSSEYANTSTFELAKSLLKDTPIIGVEIKGQSINDRSNSVHLIVGTHHGNEWGSAEVTMRAVEDFAKTPLIGKDLIIIPVLMPDSFKRRSRNYAGVNPNRDYPGPCGSHDGNGKAPFQLNATQALSDLIRDRNIISAITVHNPWETVHYPWSVERNSKTDEHEFFKYLLEESYKDTPYRIGTVADMFYTMKGAFSDYVFWEFGVWGVLVEIGGGKRPSMSTVQKKTKLHLEAFRKFLNIAPDSRSNKNIFNFSCDERSDEFHLHFHE